MLVTIYFLTSIGFTLAFALNYLLKKFFFKNVNLFNKLSSIKCVIFQIFVFNKLHVYIFQYLIRSPNILYCPIISEQS